jgi:hypothetical protein
MNRPQEDQMNDATDKQVAFLMTLGKEIREMTHGDEARDEQVTGFAIATKVSRQNGELSKKVASALIEGMLTVKKRWEREDREQRAETRGYPNGTGTARDRHGSQNGRPEPDAGMYKVGDRILRVYLGQQSGRMLVKELIRDDVDLLVGGESTYSYEYLGAAAYKLPADAERLSLEEAKRFGKMSGHCCVCGRRLDDPESVDAGIGPVCSGRIEEDRW